MLEKEVRKRKLYLIEIQGVEPFERGPYPSEESRNQVARTLRTQQKEDDLLFRADVLTTGELIVESFSAGFFMEDEHA